jgi:3-oxoacyl-[acyl-carrier-protein] synthase III
MTRKVGLIGFGYAVPPHVRTNDDVLLEPIRAAARARGDREVESKLFFGVRERRYLRPEEDVESLMVAAGQMALHAAGIAAGDIDRLYGYSSVSEYVVPNGLFKVHERLGLSGRAMVVPINREFSTFILGVVLAWEAILAGRCTYAMVNCGSGWTRNMDYTASHAVSIGDGAGAAIVGPSDRWTILDHADETFTCDDDYHGLTMKVRVSAAHGMRYVVSGADGLPVPTFQISEGGVRSFMAHGMWSPVHLARRLLDGHAILRENTALMTHQGSQVLMDHWKEQICPGEYPTTLEEFGNMTLASVPVTLAVHADVIRSEHVLLATPGPGVHASALLLQR